MEIIAEFINNNIRFLIFAWILVASVVAFAITICDKYKAVYRSKKRISERALFTWAALGGAFVMLLTMKAISHKTKHKRFMIGLPVIILIQTLIIWFVFS